jgi:hypothetical protein
MSSEDKDAIVQGKIEETPTATATPKRRKRAVSWADQSSICEEPANEVQKEDDKPLAKIDSTDGRSEEAKPKPEQ